MSPAPATVSEICSRQQLGTLHRGLNTVSTDLSLRAPEKGLILYI